MRKLQRKEMSSKRVHHHGFLEFDPLWTELLHLLNLLVLSDFFAELKRHPSPISSVTVAHKTHTHTHTHTHTQTHKLKMITFENAVAYHES